MNGYLHIGHAKGRGSRLGVPARYDRGVGDHGRATGPGVAVAAYITAARPEPDPHRPRHQPPRRPQRVQPRPGADGAGDRAPSSTRSASATSGRPRSPSWRRRATGSSSSPTRARFPSPSCCPPS
jgi:hypothetical protein